jgi:hypothetical protein
MIFLICIILTKWFLAHFAELRGCKSIISKCIFVKWKKEREPPAMIRRPEVRILLLVIQRQNPTDIGLEGSKKH